METRFRARFRRRTFRFSEHSLRQVCDQAGVPPAFLGRMPAALGVGVLRSMLAVAEHADGRQVLLRFRAGDPPVLRAVLPQSYVRLDDEEVLDEVRRATDGEDFEAFRVSVDDDSLFLRLASPREYEVGAPGAGDRARAGFDIHASETGAWPLTIRRQMLRLVCQNGLTAESDAGAALRTRYTRLGRESLRAALAGTLKEVATWGASAAEAMAAARGDWIADPRAEIASIFRDHGLGSPRGRLGRWVAERVVRDVSLFGVRRFDLVQAFTAVARELEHRDRMRLEDAMGRYLVGGPASAADQAVPL